MPIDPPKEGSVKTVWTLGRNSRNCHGFGICEHKKTTITIGKLPPYTFPDPPVPTATTAYSGVYKVTGRDAIWVEFDDISAQNIRNYFGRNDVVLEEAFVVDPQVVQVGISNGFTIPAGTYNLQRRTASGLYGILVSNNNR